LKKKNWSSKESRSGIFSISEGDISLPGFFIKSTGIYEVFLQNFEEVAYSQWALVSIGALGDRA
jgi:hypothetical protein